MTSYHCGVASLVISESWYKTLWVIFLIKIILSNDPLPLSALPATFFQAVAEGCEFNLPSVNVPTLSCSPGLIRSETVQRNPAVLLASCVSWEPRESASLHDFNAELECLRAGHSSFLFHIHRELKNCFLFYTVKYGFGIQHDRNYKLIHYLCI